MNIIDILYRRYPEIDEYARSKNWILASMKDIEKHILIHPDWLEYVIKNSRGRNLDNLKKTIKTHGYIKLKSSSNMSDLLKDKKYETLYKNYLKQYLKNLCFVCFEPTDLLKTVVKTRAEYGEDLSCQLTTNLSDDYVFGIIDECYAESQNEIMFPETKEAVEWENRPEFPKAAILFILQKEKLAYDSKVKEYYRIVNFVEAIRGSDFDVAGKLICSDDRLRNSGVAKFTLATTILMCKEYKVKHVCIQALLGTLSVQFAVYTRIGFHSFFPEELLKRRTFYDEYYSNTNDETYQLFLTDRKKHDEDWNRNNPIARISGLYPMWIDVQKYDYTKINKVFNVSGYNYHSDSSDDSWLSLGLNSLKSEIVKTAYSYLPSSIFSADKYYIEKEEHMSEINPPPLNPRILKGIGQYCDIDRDCISEKCRDNKCVSGLDETYIAQIKQHTDELREKQRRTLSTEEREILEELEKKTEERKRWEEEDRLRGESIKYQYKSQEPYFKEREQSNIKKVESFREEIKDISKRSKTPEGTINKFLSYTDTLMKTIPTLFSRKDKKDKKHLKPRLSSKVEKSPKRKLPFLAPSPKRQRFQFGNDIPTGNESTLPANIREAHESAKPTNTDLVFLIYKTHISVYTLDEIKKIKIKGLKKGIRDGKNIFKVKKGVAKAIETIFN